MPTDPLDELGDDARLRAGLASLRAGTPPAVRLDAEVLGAMQRARARRPVQWAFGAAVAAAGIVLAVWPVPRAGVHQVELRLETPASRRVYVVGDFNDWNPAATPLTRTSRSTTWTVRLLLPPGRYRYTFLLDGDRWTADPTATRAADRDYGQALSMLTVM